MPCQIPDAFGWFSWTCPCRPWCVWSNPNDPNSRARAVGQPRRRLLGKRAHHRTCARPNSGRRRQPARHQRSCVRLALGCQMRGHALGDLYDVYVDSLCHELGLALNKQPSTLKAKFDKAIDRGHRGTLIARNIPFTAFQSLRDLPFVKLGRYKSGLVFERKENRKGRLENSLHAP